MNKKTICIVADQHSLYDDRSYWKQAVSLKRTGYNVFYILTSIREDDSGGQTNEGIHYKILKKRKYFRNRHINYLYKLIFPVKTEYTEIFNICKQVNADLYQIIDLRPNRVIQKIKNLSQKPKLIYDIREPRDHNLLNITMAKWHIPDFIKNLYAKYIQNWEYRISKNYDYIIGVDDKIEDRVTKNVPGVPYKTIYNFTNLKEQRKHISLASKKYDAAYMGGISEQRGVMTIMEAARIVQADFPDIKILLLGQIYDPALKSKIEHFVKNNHLENNVIIKNFIPYSEIANFYNDVKIGLNPLHRIKAHEGIIQIKLFEYMNFGIPVITSNFGYMQSYVLENNAGICTDPNDPVKLADAIKYLLNHPDELQRLGANGIKAVDEKYNWAIMEREYLEIIKTLLSSDN